MLKVMGKDGTFFFYTGCTLLSAIFVYFLLPETKRQNTGRDRANLQLQ
jgi:facilitated trehalose transporter